MCANVHVYACKCVFGFPLSILMFSDTTVFDMCVLMSPLHSTSHSCVERGVYTGLESSVIGSGKHLIWPRPTGITASSSPVQTWGT